MEAHRLVLRVGEQRRVPLGGPGSAGYGWDVDVAEAAGIVEVSLEPLPLPPRPSPGGPPPASFSVQFELVIVALAPGAAEVRACLRRPWERDKLPLRELRLTLSVTA